MQSKSFSPIEIPSKLLGLCQDLKLLESKISDYDSDLSEVRICCVCARLGTQAWQRPFAKVETKSFRGNWPDRFICGNHYTYVKRCLARVRFESRLKSKPLPVSTTPEPEVVEKQADEFVNPALSVKQACLEVVGAMQGKLIGVTVIRAHVARIRGKAHKETVRYNLLKLEESGDFVSRKMYGETCYRIAAIPLKEGDRVADCVWSDTARYGWVEGVSGERITVRFATGVCVLHRDRLDYIDNLFIDRQVQQQQQAFESGSVGDFRRVPLYLLQGVIGKDGLPNKEKVMAIAHYLGFMPKGKLYFGGKYKGVYLKTIKYLDIHHSGWRNGRC